MTIHTITDNAGIVWQICSETGKGTRLTPFPGGSSKRAGRIATRMFPVLDPKPPNDLSGLAQDDLSGMAGFMLRHLLAARFNSRVDSLIELRFRFKDQSEADRVAAVEAYAKARL